MSEPTSTIANVINAASAATIVVSIAGLIPPLAALFAIMWYMIQIIESKTAQKYLEARRIRKSSIRLAKLKAKQMVIEAELATVAMKQEHQATAEIRVEGAKQEAATLVKTVSDLEKSKPTT